MPHTSAGRFAGIAIMLTGIAVLGGVAGSLAELFHLQTPSGDEPAKATAPEEPAVTRLVEPELTMLQAQLQAVELQLHELAELIRAGRREPE